MKNIIIAVLLVSLIGLGIFVLKPEGITSIKDLTSNLQQTVDNTLESVKSGVDAGLNPNSDKIPVTMRDLPSDTALSLVLPAKAILPAITHIENFVVKVKSSGLGKKLKLDEIINESVEAAQANAITTTDTESTNDDTADLPGFQEIMKNLKNLDQIDLLLRSKTSEGTSPLLKINAAFKDDTYGKQLQQTLENLVKTSKDGEGPELKKDDIEPETYVLNVKPPMAPVELLAKVKSSGKEINATLEMVGSSGSAKIENPSEAKTSKTATLLSESAISKDAFASYMNLPNLRSLIMLVEGSLSDKSKSAGILKAIDSSHGFYKESAANAIFENGLKTNGCFSFEAGAPAYSSLKSAIDVASNRKSQFYKLISPRTTLALRMDGAFAGSQIETMAYAFAIPASSQNAASQTSSEVAAASSEMLAQLKIAQEEFQKLKISDVGIIANAPTMSFIPDVGIYIEHDASVSIEQFSEVLQALFKKLAPPSISGKSPISISKDSAGQTQVLIPAMDGYEVAFKAISETQFLGSIQESYFDEAKQLLAANDSFVNDAKLTTKNVNLKISDNDNFYYLSTSSLMPLVRQFAPFIAMSKPELKISDSELNQFLEIFDFNVLITSKNRSAEDGLLCSSGQAAVY